MRADGTHAVLKVNPPGPESEHEADALAFWGGRGAVRLLAHDRARRALLIERCEPGTQLWAVPEEEAYAIAASVFRALWRPAGGPYRRLEAEALRWADELPARWERHGRPCSRRLLDEGVALARELATSQGELVLCHQDAHGGNMLLAGDRWVVIDPKPLLGEREFDLASSLRDRRWAHPERWMARRLDGFADALGVDRERARGWGLVHALAWGVGDDWLFPELVACADALSTLA